VGSCGESLCNRFVTKTLDLHRTAAKHRDLTLSGRYKTGLRELYGTRKPTSSATSFEAAAATRVRLLAQ
jgi:hypothetical protein